MKVRKILVPVDFSDCSRVAFQLALTLARTFGASIQALHVVTPPPYLPLDMALFGDTLSRHEEQVAADMRSLVEALVGDQPVAVEARIESGVPVDAIVVASENADLVVMGTHGRSGLSHLLLGSVAERTLRLAACPVLTVPLPPGARHG